MQWELNLKIKKPTIRRRRRSKLAKKREESKLKELEAETEAKKKDKEVTRRESIASEDLIEEEEPDKLLDLAAAKEQDVLQPNGGVFRNGQEIEWGSSVEIMSFISERWTSLEYEQNYFVYVLLHSRAPDILKDNAGQRKKTGKGNAGEAEKRMYFCLRKHKLAGAAQDPIVLTSKVMIGGGVPMLTLILGTHEEGTLYNTKVDWGAAMRAVSVVFDANKDPEEENKKRDLGKVDGDTIMFAMGDITALNAINQEATKPKLKVYKNMPGFVKLDGNRMTE
eukprot:gene2988-3805_t